MARKKDANNSKTNEEITTPEPVKKVPFRFGPGNKFGGRPKGSRNKFAEEFIKDFLADWEVAGASAIQACRLEDPAAYVRIAASLIPKEFSIKDGKSDFNQIIDQLSDDQLAQLHGLVSALCDQAADRDSDTKALPRE